MFVTAISQIRKLEVYTLKVLNPDLPISHLYSFHYHLYFYVSLYKISKQTTITFLFHEATFHYTQTY